MTDADGLRALFEPRSLAVVGASDDPAKWGNWLARGALRGRDRRAVYLVNRRGGEVLGEPARRSLAELPEAPELVVLAVPASALEAAVDEALDRGARALVAITAGLGESGEEGRRRQEALVERVRGAGARLLGPNCLGVWDAAASLELASNELPQGALGLISQSGNLALELGVLAEQAGIGFSRFASLGNAADVDAAELLHSFASHEPTRAIALYVEDFRDGRALARAAGEAVAAGKPVVLLTVGASHAAVRAARSHTGAMASDALVVDAACRAAGMLRVATPGELIDAALALLRLRPLRGRRVAVLADGGGHGALAADALAARGLELPALGPDTRARLAAELPATAATANPVDLAGGGEQDLRSYARCAGRLLESGEVDAVLLTGYFGGYAEYSPSMAEGEVGAAVELAERAGAALVAHTMYPTSLAATELRERGVPVYARVESAAAGVAALAARPAPEGVPDLPPATDATPVDGYVGARQLVASCGIDVVAARTVATLEAAREAAAELGYPLALKALGALHKSDAGGVVLGIEDVDALERAVGEMQARLAPPRLSLERMAPLAAGAEVIVGARWDERFGPVVLAGAGGVYAELLGRPALALAPLDDAAAEALLLRSGAAPLLRGARGRPPLDLAAAAAAASALSRLAAARPDLAEVEVNPLLVLAHGAVALDARAVARSA